MLIGSNVESYELVNDIPKESEEILAVLQIGLHKPSSLYLKLFLTCTGLNRGCTLTVLITNILFVAY